MYKLASHNSWSYAKPKKWWMIPFRFAARCQDYDIKTQYEKYGVRCFDLRLKFGKDGELIIAHGQMVYDLTCEDIYKDLEYLNEKGDCYVRTIHEVRNEKDYKQSGVERFDILCYELEERFRNIKFWNGCNLYNGECDHAFKDVPTCEERYSSVCKPRLIDDWYPRIYAKLNNKKNLEEGTDKMFYMIDFVNYQ